MKRSVEVALIETQNRMLGHVASMSYLFCNVCVKADPSSLLGVEMVYGGMDKRIEDVADILVHEDENEKHMMNVYPKDSAYFSCIYKGITEVHPEFKVTLETAPGADDENGIDAKYLLLTMPDVNKERKDLLDTATDALYSECKTKIEAEKTRAASAVASRTVGSSEEAVKEAKDKLQEIFDTYSEMMERLYNDKKKEIEEAYNRHVAGNAKDTSTTDITKGGQSMKLDKVFNSIQDKLPIG
ncbi:MAG: ribosome recycling factor [Bacteroidales bacterium]|nr:ribosome recycling factor [Bacteroidales bacterium]